MIKRLQVEISPAAWEKLERDFNEAATDFKMGTIRLSDIVTEMILSSELNIEELRRKHIDVKKSLRALADMDGVDIDTVLKTMNDLKSKPQRKIKAQTDSEGGS